MKSLERKSVDLGKILVSVPSAEAKNSKRKCTTSSGLLDRGSSNRQSNAEECEKMERVSI
ncbi:MAG: hypothetical protein CL943_01810 [Candidatus Diapherotrites archaeon]|uniref:Uncharacterized protein n=1 Tax=Candidatus Iainarchaeum sp. TaxID=3101447 RepID=A0A2D6M0W5_9ARCH|nr:hypothetical protein [Candidatus Diapherotrites archaeon]